MKKRILLSTFAFLALSATAQLNTDTLSENNATAIITEAGWLFSTPEASATLLAPNMRPGYEWPAGSNKHLLNGVGLWLEGEDVNGQHKASHVAANTFSQQFPGAGTVMPGSAFGGGNGIHSWEYLTSQVTLEQVEYHRANYNDPNYQIPEAILNWPAHGDVTQDAPYYLAPFVDVDDDNNYNPLAGDYPCIAGDVMAYTVLNSKENEFSFFNPQGPGFELRYSIFQYTSVPGLEDVTFCSIEVINRSTETLFDFNAGIHMDGLIGASEDDFAGTDVQRNMLFAYNGDNLDTDSPDLTGYGVAPPAVGVKLLNHNLSSSKIFQSALDTHHVFPDSREKFIEVMNGNLYDGTPNPIQYSYDGDPVNNTGSIATLAEAKSVGVFDLNTMSPGDTFYVDFAVVVGQGTSNINSITELRNNADFVQSFYDGLGRPCARKFLNMQEINNDFDISVYPNPNDGRFVLEIENPEGNISYSILDVNGRIVQEKTPVLTNKTAIEVSAAKGMYFLNISTDNNSRVIQLIVD